MSILAIESAIYLVFITVTTVIHTVLNIIKEI